MSEEYVLQLQHIRKEYPGVVALKAVTLELKPGEILALIGENGAGKSTLIKCCSGAVIPTSGKIIVNGKEFSSMTPQLASENGIAIIYQEFNNVKELSAAENLFLGRPIRKGIVIDKKAIAGFIGGADHIQPRLKVQLGAVQSAKGGAHLLDLQGITSLSYMVHVAG